jgi:hypothetical protein
MVSCDISPTRNWLIAAGTGIGASAILVGAAAIANASFFGAAASPGLMIGAGVFAVGARYALSKADDALTSYCTCLKVAEKDCGGQCGNLSRNIEAISLVMSIEAPACFGTAVAAWLPWAAQPAMLVILGSLIMEGVLTTSAVAFLIALVQCAERGDSPINVDAITI